MEQPLKVLVVDDDPVTLTLVRALLEKEGHEVLVRDTGFGTGATIIEAGANVVLLDVEMPGLSGDSVARLIRDRRKRPGEDVCCILHSSRGQEELDRLARESGALGAISKSGDSDAFLRRFRTLIASARNP